MNKYFMLTAIFSTIIIGCGSSSTTTGCTTYECVDNLNGGGGSDSTSAGGSDQGTEFGGSTNFSSSSTGGASVVTSSSSVGAGGSSVGGSNAVGGTSNTTTTTPICIPKTCNDIVPEWDFTKKITKPIACDDPNKPLSDGCGGRLSCGDCPPGDGTVDNIGCGQAPNIQAWKDLGLVPTPNVCGSRCVRPNKLGAIPSMVCSNNTEGWVCPSSIEPLGLTGCTIVNSTAHTWCCDS